MVDFVNTTETIIMSIPNDIKPKWLYIIIAKSENRVGVIKLVNVEVKMKTKPNAVSKFSARTNRFSCVGNRLFLNMVIGFSNL